MFKDNLVPSTVIEFDCGGAVGWWRHFPMQLLIFSLCVTCCISKGEKKCIRNIRVIFDGHIKEYKYGM
jgi:hypothetical protein